MMILEDPVKGLVVPDLIEREVGTVEDALKVIEVGGRRRTMAHTGANIYSTRSHAVLFVGIYKND